MALAVFRVNKDGGLSHISQRTFMQNLDAAYANKEHLIKDKAPQQPDTHWGAFAVTCCPWRKVSPMAAQATQDKDIFEPHKPCVFDRPEVIKNESLMAFSIDDRLYYLMLNIRPVRHQALLLVKEPATDASMLNQVIHGHQDLTDAMAMQQLFPADFSFFFNSNPGGSTHSGASVNHFHIQTFRMTSPIQKAAVSPVPLASSLREVRFWPASMRIFDIDTTKAPEQSIYNYLQVLTANQNAYNIVFFNQGPNNLRVVIIPRNLGIPLTPAFPGHSPQRFGADDMLGDFFIIDQQAFDALNNNPLRAQRILSQWLIEMSADKQTMARFDQEFLRK